MTRYYADRIDAGHELALALLHHARTDAVVLALPRGGVPIGDEIAATLGLPLDVCVVRKIGAPHRPELGLGAVAEGPRVYLDPDLIELLGVTSRQLWATLRREHAEVRRRVARLRGGRPLPALHGRTAILVDDGLATGGTMRAAIRAVHKRGAGHVVVAVPVGAPATLAAIARTVDEVVCPLRPTELYAVGAWYADFHQILDEDVARILARARQRELAMPAAPREAIRP